ncbi:hypothetical protein PTKIN_Ptkin05aG0018100 [Pterospermum kingtungense]
MASRVKKKVKNHEEEEVAKDRLSDLPDGLLLHILSFLPETKLSVRTCVLSKRWKSLWASLPDLVFSGWDDIALFKKTVRKVLSGRNNIPVRKFHFSYPGRDKSLITRIINYSVSHNVQHFSIALKFPPMSILFPLFNGCRSLKTLELEYIGGLFMLKDISIPTLTTLHISYCSFFPIEWTVTDKTIYSVDPFVGVVNLKSLKIVDCESFSGTTKTYPMKFSNLDFPLSETADVDVAYDAASLFGERSLLPLNLMNLFRGLYHAQSLYLSSRTIEVLTKFPGLLEDQAFPSPFCRLKTLNVRSCEPLSIPDNLMNYFVRGTTFGQNLSIKIAEERKLWSYEKKRIFRSLIQPYYL